MGLFKKNNDKGGLYAALDEYLRNNYVPPFEAMGSAAPMQAAGMMNFAAKQSSAVNKKAARKEAARVFADECMPMMNLAAEVAEEEEAAEDVEISEAKPARSIDEVIAQVSESWQESLFRLIDEKGFSDTEVYKRADIDRKLFSKIRCSRDYRPKKNTAIAFALALRLNLDETKDFLMRAGDALSKSSRAYLIVEFFIQNEVYDLITINTALYDHNEQALSS
ncbi:MAG: hypothetical protein IKR27_01320 [Lachnospiraceae bacterium]|nr:hypothetical protein [Lachnospiraceae bacterium]